MAYSTPRASILPPNLKLTPNAAFSPPTYNRTPIRSPIKTRAPTLEKETHGLVLKRMIGTTSNSSSGLAAHTPSRSLAFCAGAAVCVVQIDENLKVSQKYFLRARPNATQSTIASSSTPSTPSNDARVRTAASIREQGIGYSPSNVESPGKLDDSKNWSAKERVKAATTISFSPDGRFLAVGETGYNPRVLIYSMAPEGSSEKAPIAILSEHAFGVRCVKFSPCSRYLASIGTMNDGFVYIWTMPTNKHGIVRLHSSNRCTSLVRDIAWMGKSLITVGLRHVKVWKIEEEATSPETNKALHQFFEKLTVTKMRTPGTAGPSVLPGRNVLLGIMSDNLFTSVVGIADDKALVATDKGDICLLDDSCQRFAKVMNAEFGVSCISVDPDCRFAWVAGRQGSIRTILLQEIISPFTPPESPASRSGSPVLPAGCKPADVIAMTTLGEHLITIDSNKTLKVINLTEMDGLLTPDSVAHEFASHRSSAQGVKQMPPSTGVQADFYTYSSCGTVLFWDFEGACQSEMTIEVEQPNEGADDYTNELKIVEMMPSGDLFVTGDKFGVMRIINAANQQCEFVVKAHSGEIMDIDVYELNKARLIATCARDRTVQVFAKFDYPGSTWSLVQTLEDHTASATRVRFMEDGNKLVSSSVDRTIVVRDLAIKTDTDQSISLLAYLPVRTITLKSAAVHITPCNSSGPNLMASTAGRQIVKYDVSTGRELHSFKALDDSGDSVVMDALVLGKERSQPGRARLLAGISTTDKTIRVYDTAGNLIDKEWGHTEGVSDLIMVENQKNDSGGSRATLVSTGTDGTVMMWNFTPKVTTAYEAEPQRENSFGITTPIAKEPMTATQAPLRKVLSRSDMMELSRTSPEKEYTPTRASSRIGSRATTPKPPIPKQQPARDISKISGKFETPKIDSRMSMKPQVNSRITRSSSPNKATPPTSINRSVSPAKVTTATNTTPTIARKPSFTQLTKSNTTPSSSTPKLTLSAVKSTEPSPTVTALRSHSFDESKVDRQMTYDSGTVRRYRMPSPEPSTLSPPETLKSISPMSKAPVRRPSFGSTRLPTGGAGSRVSATISREVSDAANANALAEQLAQSLKLFRRRFKGAHAVLKKETKKDLESELDQTLSCIAGLMESGSSSRLSPRGSPQSEPASRAEMLDDSMMPLLQSFSEKLLLIMQDKINSPTTSPTKTDYSSR